MNLKNEIEKKANSWLIRQKEGLTSFEQKEFELWFENKHHKKIYEENKNLIDEILTQVKVKNVQVEKIVGIPFSIVENGEKNIQLKQNEYLVKNEKGDRTIINKKDIYGVVTVIKTNKNK